MSIIVKINGQPLPNPTDIERGEFDVTESDRTADATMVREVIATKRKIEVLYDALSTPEYAAIKALLVGKGLFEVEFPAPETGTAKMIAYPGDITDRAWHTVEGIRWWLDVRIPLIEQ